MTHAAAPLVPVSWGELIDKLTILELKHARLADAAARANVARERGRLAAIAAPVLAQVAPLVAELRAINAELWEVEDAIRAEDAAGRFGDRFVALARAVYRRNDERARVKRRIDDLLGSELVEEKSYASFTAPSAPSATVVSDAGSHAIANIAS